MNNSFINFDWEKYLKKYEDLKNLTTKEESWDHWKKYGMNEKRIFFYNDKTDSNVKIYNDYLSLIDDNYDKNNITIDDKNNITIDDKNNIAIDDKNNIAIDDKNNIVDDKNNIYSYNDEYNEEYENEYDEDNNNNYLIELKNEYMKIIYTKNNFDWIKYINDNKDLSHILDYDNAWHHWVMHGHREKRKYNTNISNIIVNNTEVHNGRFGNIFFINMVLHFISKKYNLKTVYKYNDKFDNLGIELFIGDKTYNKNIYLTEINYFKLMNKKKNFTNIIVNNNSWFQNYEFCIFLKIYFNKIKIKNKIIQNNKFYKRYNNNNDLFVHVRLDDIEEKSCNNTFNYYDKIIKKYSFDNGYIASDNLNSLICSKLIKKYSLKIIDYNEEETIMFGSTCNTIILSGGTFSWLIGFFAYYAKNINYPILNNKWYGDIFVYNNWIGNY